MLRVYCKELGLHYSAAHIDRFNKSHSDLLLLTGWLPRFAI
jgi:hypothetical protein